jgi:hypothetical protein
MARSLSFDEVAMRAGRFLLSSRFTLRGALRSALRSARSGAAASVGMAATTFALATLALTTPLSAFADDASASAPASVSASASTSSPTSPDACGQLVGQANTTPPGGFQLRTGEPVDFVSGGKTVHGTLQIFGEGGAFRVYWQPKDKPDHYVLANAGPAGSNRARLVATPTQGSPAPDGKPGITMPPMQVLSCPTL